MPSLHIFSRCYHYGFWIIFLKCTQYIRYKTVPFSPHLFQNLLFVYFFDDGHSDQCEVVPHCGFNLHFLESRKMVQMNLFAGQNIDANVENGLVDKAGEEEGRTNRESSPDVCTLPCVKEIASGKLSTAQGAQLGAL